MAEEGLEMCFHPILCIAWGQTIPHAGYTCEAC